MKNSIYDVTDARDNENWMLRFSKLFPYEKYTAVWVRKRDENRLLFMTTDMSLKFFFYREHLAPVYEKGKFTMEGHVTLNKTDKKKIQDKHGDDIKRGAMIILEKLEGDKSVFIIRSWNELNIMEV
jgi:hypothetical protein